MLFKVTKLYDDDPVGGGGNSDPVEPVVEEEPVSEEETKTFAEAAGLPEMNVTYEFALEGLSDVNAILMALQEQNGENAVSIPGYSVMEQIVENLLVYLGYESEDEAAFRAIAFPNSVSKIAYLIKNAPESESEPA